MQVDEKKAKFRVQHEGRTYYFCSEGCMHRFQENPQKYVAQSSTDWDRP